MTPGGTGSHRGSEAGGPPTILVLGAGGNVSQGILKALAHADLALRVVAACVTAHGAGLYQADRAYLSPYADDPGFVDWVIDVCRREGVRAVASGAEPVLAALAPAAARIAASTGAVCLVSPPDVLEVGQDKLLTCRWLAERGLPHPMYADSSDRPAVLELARRCGFPLVAKPRRGRSAEGVVQLTGAEELERVAGVSGLVVQEHLAGEDGEYTAGCLCDREGRVRGTMVMRRRLSRGTTVQAEVGEFPAVREVAERVVGALRPVGPCNVQLRLGERGPVPFELNVRFSGTTPARAHFGFNEVEAAVRHLALGDPARDLSGASAGTVLRYWNEMYVTPESVEALAHGHRLEDPRAQPPTIEDWGQRA